MLVERLVWFKGDEGVAAAGSSLAGGVEAVEGLESAGAVLRGDWRLDVEGESAVLSSWRRLTANSSLLSSGVPSGVVMLFGRFLWCGGEYRAGVGRACVGGQKGSTAPDTKNSSSDEKNSSPPSK